MKEITDLIGQLEQSENEFYKTMIELHNNTTLRKFADENGDIYISKSDDERLFYTETGFGYVTPEYDNYYDSNMDGFYEFKVQDKKLKSKHSQRTELTKLFPRLTLDQVMSKIEKEISKRIALAQKGNTNTKSINDLLAGGAQ
jgi:hypothetical protein